MWSPRRRAWPSSLSSKRASWSPPEQAAASWLPDWLTDVRPYIHANASVDRGYMTFGSLFSVSERLGVFLLPCSQQQANAYGPEERAGRHKVIWCLFNVNYSTSMDNSDIPGTDFKDCAKSLAGSHGEKWASAHLVCPAGPFGGCWFFFVFFFFFIKLLAWMLTCGVQWK